MLFAVPSDVPGRRRAAPSTPADPRVAPVPAAFPPGRPPKGSALTPSNPLGLLHDGFKGPCGDRSRVSRS